MKKRASTTPAAKRKRKPPAAPDAWKPKFLEALRDSGIVRTACEAARINRTAAYHARTTSGKAGESLSAAQAFAAAWDEALEEACDLLEREAWRRAHEGVAEPVFYQGEEVGAIRRYSDALLMFLLRAHRPQRFSERIRQDTTTLNVDVTKLSLDQLERLANGEDVRTVLATPGPGGTGAAAPAAEPGPAAGPVADPIS